MSFGDNFNHYSQELESIFREIRADLLTKNQYLQIGNQNDAAKVSSSIKGKLNQSARMLENMRNELSQRKSNKSM